VYASDALDNAIVVPQGEQRAATSSPTIADIYRQCKNGATYDGTKAQEGQRLICNGFMMAAVQSATNNGNGTCPAVTYRQILDKVNHKISGVEQWQQPALPWLVAALKDVGCKDH